jgi:hypothetical protein
LILEQDALVGLDVVEYECCGLSGGILSRGLVAMNLEVLMMLQWIIVPFEMVNVVDDIHI